MLLLEWDLYLPREAALERDALRSLCYRQNNLPCWNVICCRGLFGVWINEKDKHDDCWWFSVTRLLLGDRSLSFFLCLSSSQLVNEPKHQIFQNRRLSWQESDVCPCLHHPMYPWVHTCPYLHTQHMCAQADAHSGIWISVWAACWAEERHFLPQSFSSTQMQSTQDPEGTPNILAGSNLSHKIKPWNSGAVKGNSAINPLGAQSFTTCGLRLWNKSVPWVPLALHYSQAFCRSRSELERGIRNLDSGSFLSNICEALTYEQGCPGSLSWNHL